MTSRFAVLPERHARFSLARLRACGGVSLLALLVAAPAHAQLDLTWDAPPPCPPASFVHEKVRALAGTALSRAEPLRAEGTIEHDGEEFRLTLRVRDGAELRQRVISSHSCSDLAGAAAVTLALLLKANEEGTNVVGAGSGDGSERTNAQPVAPSAETPSNTPGTDAGAADASSSGRAVDSAFIVQLPVLTFEHGPLPLGSSGAGFAIGLRRADYRFLAGARAFLARSLPSPARSRTGAEVRRMTGVALACRGFGDGRLEISPCLTLVLERLTARGFGLGVSPRTREALWVAPGATALAHLHAFQHLAFFVEAAARVEVSRPRLVIEDLGEVARVAPAAFSGSIGAEWIF
jgi:hypothetical protein